MKRSVIFGCTAILLALLGWTPVASASCTFPANNIEAENCLPGNPQSEWDISGTGDPSIQGFATDISVNVGGTVNFKINSSNAAFTLTIYRMGYYGGNGARKVATVSGPGSQNQLPCLPDSSTGPYDCGNWAVSASWTAPTTAISGIYFARAVSAANGGASHIFFIVRDDASKSDLLFQTSDLSWQAYNDYGGKNVYGCNGQFDNNCRAHKVSYNRPFHTRAFQDEAATWVFNAEYPMVRWLEANGYDVSYFTGVDTERNAALIRNHKVWMSNGHDEYWSAGERASVQAARDAGVHLAFFSGNTMFWKTRWENSTASTDTSTSNPQYRTLVCYKETHANAVIDPADPPIWTGTWRDPRFSPPADGGKPENAIVGTLFRMNGGQNAAIKVPQADGRMRFWRNTSVANLTSGQTATLAPGTIGAEFDDDEDNGFRPAGLIELSNTPITDSGSYLLDYGSTYGSGTAIHKVTLYKAPSGALVFATGTYQWAWGLDSHHDQSNLGSTTNVAMQQATVNLFADMGVQPTTIQTGLTAATASTDRTAPSSTITSPTAGSNLAVGGNTSITGTAADTGGALAAVEVSVDAGTTWHPANGTGSWSYAWTPGTSGSVTIKSRATDDSGNVESPSAGVNVTVGGSGTGGGGTGCTSNCTSIWPNAPTPQIPDQGADSSVELGVKFKSDTDGKVSSIRFYKASTNTGTHIGNLWDNSTGNLLGTVTFTGETSSGWQQMNFATPVSITAGTLYVASYHANVGHYAEDQNYFATGRDSPPLHALANGVSGFNGVYNYGTGSTFPTLGFNSSNYWVDVVFSPGTVSAPASIAVTPTNPAIPAGSTQQFTATGTYPDGSTQNITSQVTWSSSNTTVATINSAGNANAGLANGLSAGSSTISAKSGTVTGGTLLTVQAAQPAPLTITTDSLPSGTVNQSYSATLAATGGTTPYTWSITSGSLPLGLTLNTATGGITGTPTTAAAPNFTVQVSDKASATTKALSITITAACTSCTLWPSSSVPGIPDDGPDKAVELGVKFKADKDGTIIGIRFYKANTNTGTHVAHLWTGTGTKLVTATFSGESASGWQQVNFTPVSIKANTVYVASYHTTVGHYADDQGFFANGVDSVPLHALQDGISGVNGVFAYGSGTFPNQGFNSSNYWVDVVFK
ncbi:MAG: N,N-dimethylformamidase beta subunit family domain-containing protein [Bryobacteraceae bacterium]